MILIPSMELGSSESKWYINKQKLNERNFTFDMIFDSFNTVIDATDTDAIDSFAEQISIYMVDSKNSAPSKIGRIFKRAGMITDGIDNILLIANTIDTYTKVRLRPDSPINSLRKIQLSINAAVRVVDHTAKFFGPIGIAFTKPFTGFLKYYQKGMNAAINSLERLGGRLGKWNRVAMDLGELNTFAGYESKGFNPYLYPGAKEYSKAATEFLALKKQQERMKPIIALLRKLAAKLKYRQKMMAEFEDKSYPDWIKKVSAEFNSQLKSGEYKSKKFAALYDDFSENNMGKYKKYLTKDMKELYNSDASKSIALANSKAEEAAQAGAALKEANSKYAEATAILNACEKNDIDIEVFRQNLNETMKSLKESARAFNGSTIRYMEAYHYFALWDAIEKHEVYAVKLKSESILKRYNSIYKYTLEPAKIIRVSPKDGIINLPDKISKNLKKKIKVKVLNVLGKPLNGIELTFHTYGEIIAKERNIKTDKSGDAESEMTIFKDIKNNLANSKIKVYCNSANSYVKPLYYSFVKPGVPADIMQATAPGDAGAPSSLMKTPWEIYVVDKDGIIINNKPVSVRFQALDGGSVSIIKASLTPKGKEPLPIDECKLSAKVKVGPENGKIYHYRATWYKGAKSITKEIAVRADETLKDDGRIIPHSIALNFANTPLAADKITADVLGYPREVSFKTTVVSTKVKNLKHDHFKMVDSIYYKTVKYTDKNGKAKTKKEKVTVKVSRLDFTHPISQILRIGRWEEDLKADESPRAKIIGARVVSIDSKNKKIEASSPGTSRLIAQITGIKTKKKTHDSCSKTLVTTGIISSDTSKVRVVRIKRVNYHTIDTNIFSTWLAPMLILHERSAHIILSDKSSKNKRTFYDVITEGDSHYTQRDKKIEGAGRAEIYSYIKDKNGKKRFAQQTGKVTLNIIDRNLAVNEHIRVPQGELKELVVTVKGGADMSNYYLDWSADTRSAHGSNKSLKTGILNAKSRFRRIGSMTWESRNYIWGPVADEIVSWSGSLKASLYKNGDKSNKLASVEYYLISFSPPRLNQLAIRTSRGKENNYIARTEIDLFSGAPRPLLNIKIMGIFGRSGRYSKQIEELLFSDWARYSFDGGAFELITDFNTGSNSFMSDSKFVFQRGVAHISYIKTKDSRNCLYLKINNFKKIGSSELKAGVYSSDLFKSYNMKENVEPLQTLYPLKITTNKLKIDKAEEDGIKYIVLSVEGPANMAEYTAEWTLEFDDSTEVQEHQFNMAKKGNWESKIQKSQGLRLAKVILKDIYGEIVGKANYDVQSDVEIKIDEVEKDGSARNKGTIISLRRTLVDMFTSYERENTNGFMKYVSENFSNTDNNGYSYNKDELLQSLLDDFKNLDAIEFSVDINPPVGGFYYPIIEAKWQRRAFLSATGQEWMLKDRMSVLAFEFDEKLNQYFLTSIQGDPIFGLSGPSGKIVMDRKSRLDGFKVGKNNTIDDGKLELKNFHIVACNPTSGMPGNKNITMYIYGVDFEDNSTIYFIPNNNITVNSQQYISKGIYKINFDIKENAKVGSYHISMRKKNGKRVTLINGYEVIGAPEDIIIDFISPSTVSKANIGSFEVHGSGFNMLPAYPEMWFEKAAAPGKKIEVMESEKKSNNLIKLFMESGQYKEIGLYHFYIKDKNNQIIKKENAVNITP